MAQQLRAISLVPRSIERTVSDDYSGGSYHCYLISPCNFRDSVGTLDIWAQKNQKQTI